MKTIYVLLVLQVSFGVLAQPPATSYNSDWSAFVQEVDTTYPFFDLKKIRPDWDGAKPELEKRVAACTSDSEFLGIVVDGFRVLRDSHMQLSDAKVTPPALAPEFFPGIGFMSAADRRVIVMATDPKLGEIAKVGTEIVQINGTNAYEFLEKRVEEDWKKSASSSPQRARLYTYRMPLRGKQGDTFSVRYRSGTEEKDATLTCDVEARGWPHVYNMPNDLVRVGRSFLYKKLDNGVGYIYMRRVDPSVVDGMREAFSKITDATGWIVDLRGNGGGGYDDALINQIKEMPKPVAVIIDAGCISAGETLARDFAQYAGARIFGTKSAGSSSSKRQWKFPSGIATVTMATRSRWRADGQPIEFNGIDPDVIVEPVPEEVQQGKNTEILRAEEYLLSATGKR